MNPYPLYYCPPGVHRPEHCPFRAGMTMRAEASPDGKEGLLYGPGGDLPAGLAWQQSDDGWYVLLGGQRPQDLIRLNPSPRIISWHPLAGVEPGQVWRVPVLLTPMDPANLDLGYISALDRIWRGGTWGTPEIMEAVQQQLLAVANGVDLADELEARNAAMAELAVAILAQAHHVSRVEIIARGWFSETLITAVPLLAMNRVDLVDPPTEG